MTSCVLFGSQWFPGITLSSSSCSLGSGFSRACFFLSVSELGSRQVGGIGYVCL